MWLLGDVAMVGVWRHRLPPVPEVREAAFSAGYDAIGRVGGWWDAATLFWWICEHLGLVFDNGPRAGEAG